jgi:hypothetical protein
LYRNDIPIELKSIVNEYLFPALTNYTVRVAVELWFSHKKAIREFGHISDADVSQVSDMKTF